MSALPTRSAELVARPLELEEVHDWVSTYVPRCASDQMMLERWGTAAALARSVADGRTYYAYPYHGPPACVLSVTPASGPTEINSAGIRWLGDLSVVPRAAFGDLPCFRLLSKGDREQQMAHLGAKPLLHQYRRELTADSIPPMPEGVVRLDALPETGVAMWEQFYQEHEQRRRAGGGPRMAAKDFAIVTGQANVHWFLLGESGVARCKLVPEIPTWVSLDGVFVRPEHRRRGYGKALLAARLAHGLSLGVSQALCAVAPFNTESRANLIQAHFIEDSSIYLVS